MNALIFSPHDREPSDIEILSFWRLVFSPEQLLWNPDDSPELAEWDDQRVLQFYRSNLAKRPNQFGFWATHVEAVVGYVGLRIPNEPSRSHCGEIGFGVDQLHQRRGIAIRLLSSIEELAVLKGLRRLECSCFVENEAAIALLLKAGFVEEGRKHESIRIGDTYTDQVFWGKLLRSDCPVEKTRRMTMWKDSIVEEIHATRRRISAECNGDMNQIIARLRKHEKTHRERVVLPAQTKADSQVEE